MNIAAMKTALANSKNNCFQKTRVSLFHSTPVLARRRRNRYSDFRNHNHLKRYRRHCARESMLRSLNAYTDFLFKSYRKHHEYNEDDPSFRSGSSWSEESTNNSTRDRTDGQGSRRWDRTGGNQSYYLSSEDEEDDPSSSRGPSWFRREFSTNNFRRKKNKGSQHWARRGFQFCDDDDDDEIDMETVFRSAFHGNGFYYWSFVDGDNHQRRSSSRNTGRSWNWRDTYKQAYGSESDDSESDSASDASDRSVLGLRAYGPIKIEDVKTAYRSCALKWHPDRHQGSSKVVAEEKFKLCSAAYQSLCDKLGVD